MPLPYLQKKQVAGLIIQKRKSDSMEPLENEEGSEDQGLMSCAEEMIRAMHAKDASALAAALRNAMEIMESEEHEEGPEMEADAGGE